MEPTERDMQREFDSIRADMRDVLSRLENIQRSADRLSVSVQGLDVDQRMAHLLDSFRKHSETTLEHLSELDSRRSAERAESSKVLMKVFGELWNKGGQYLVLGFSLLLVGAIAKWAGLPIPFFSGYGP